MNTLLTAWKYAGENKEFFVLISILSVLTSTFIVMVKAYASFKVKQENCDGRFNLQDFKINTQDKKIDKIGKKTDEAVKSVQDIKPKVDDMHDWFKNLIDDKYEKGLTNARQEEA